MYIDWSHSTLFWPYRKIYHRVRLHVAVITIPRHIRPDHHYKLAFSKLFDTEVLVIYSMDMFRLWRGSITPRKWHCIIIHSATPRKRERMLMMWEVLMNILPPNDSTGFKHEDSGVISFIHFQNYTRLRPWLLGEWRPLHSHGDSEFPTILVGNRKSCRN